MRVARVTFAALVVLLSLDLLAVQLTRTDTLRDLFAYHRAASNVRDGLSMYDPLPPPGPHSMSRGLLYVYPPHFAAALSLSPSADPHVFARAWLVFVFAAFWGFAACLSRIAVGRVQFHATLLAGTLLWFVPEVLLTLNFGQADVLAWLGIGLALAVPAVAGAALAAVALIKLYAAWVFPAAIFRGDWRTLRQGGVALLIATGATLLVLGPSRMVTESTTWLIHVLPTLGQGQFEGGTLVGGVLRWELPVLMPMNISLTHWLVRIFNSGDGELSAAWRIYLLLTSIAAPLTVAWHGRRWRQDRHYIAVLGAALLFAPICRVRYLVALLPALAILVRDRRRHAGSATQAVGLAAGSGGEPVAAVGLR